MAIILLYSTSPSVLARSISFGSSLSGWGLGVRRRLLLPSVLRMREGLTSKRRLRAGFSGDADAAGAVSPTLSVLTDSAGSGGMGGWMDDEEMHRVDTGMGLSLEGSQWWGGVAWRI